MALVNEEKDGFANVITREFTKKMDECEDSPDEEKEEERAYYISLYANLGELWAAAKAVLLRAFDLKSEVATEAAACGVEWKVRREVGQPLRPLASQAAEENALVPFPSGSALRGHWEKGGAFS